MNNIYTRVMVYPFMWLIGLLPAWALGWIAITQAQHLELDFRAIGMGIVLALVGSFSIFAKWGIKPQDVFNAIPAASYGRIFLYSTSFIIGLLPGNIAGAVTVDAARFVVDIDLPGLGKTLGAMLVTGLGINIGVLKMFGIK